MVSLPFAEGGDGELVICNGVVGTVSEYSRICQLSFMETDVAQV